MFTIEKGIPIPTHKGENSKYPFFDMEINDSFEVKVIDTTPEKMAASVRNCYHNICKNNKELKKWKFTIRVTSDKTIRCWRVK